MGKIEKDILKNFDKAVKSRSTRCGICLSEDVDEINEAILSGLYTQKDIANKYHFNEGTVSRHKTLHILSDVKGNLRSVVYEQIMKGRVKDGTIGDVIKALQFLEPAPCDKCEFKINNDKPKRSIEEALQEYLGIEMSEEAYAKYNKERGIKVSA